MTGVEIELDGRGRGRVVIDGLDISPIVTGVSVDSAPREASEVTLRLLGVRTVRIDGDARVIVDDATRSALLAIGWTPPQEAP